MLHRVLVLCVVCASFGLFSAGASAEGVCPNEALRVAQFATFLPECRAFEMVSPAEKNGGDVLAGTQYVRAAQQLLPGEAMGAQFASLTSFGDTVGNGVVTEYMSLRTGAPGTSGWSTHAITPPQKQLTFTAAAGAEPLYESYFSPDLSTGIFRAWSALTEAPNVKGVGNLYLRDDLRATGAGSYRLVTDCPGCSAPLERSTALLGSQRPFLIAVTPDFEHMLFDSVFRLTADAPPCAQPPALVGFCPPVAYEYDHGTVRLAGILPDGTAAASSVGGAGANNGLRIAPNAISQDGSRFVFTDTGGRDSSSGTLYMRMHNGAPDAATVQLDVSERTDCNVERQSAEPGYVCTGVAEPDPSGPQRATYMDASADGTRVFFSSGEALTDSAYQRGDQHLYMYDAMAPAGHRLTQLDADSSPAVQGDLAEGGAIGASEDGRYVYFSAHGQLLDSAPVPEETRESIYLWHDDGTPGGKLIFVGYLASGLQEVYNLFRDQQRDQARVTSDGKHLLFVARLNPVTGVTNTCPINPYGCQEMYLYSADTGTVQCVSCDPSGAPTVHEAGEVILNNPPLGEGLHAASAGGSVPTGYVNHAVSDDGSRVFFSTAQALVPDDVNGKSDAYEFDSASGQVHLLSGGRSTADSFFMDESGDGRDVLIATNQRLVGWDTGDDYDIYDVRVDGGFSEPSVAAGCGGEACRGPAGAVPGVSSLSSLSAVGVGNLASPMGSRSRVKPRRPTVCGKGQVRKRVRGKSRCVKSAVHKRAVHRKRARRASHGRVGVSVRVNGKGR